MLTQNILLLATRYPISAGFDMCFPLTTSEAISRIYGASLSLNSSAAQKDTGTAIHGTYGVIKYSSLILRSSFHYFGRLPLQLLDEV